MDHVLGNATSHAWIRSLLAVESCLRLLQRLMVIDIGSRECHVRNCSKQLAELLQLQKNPLHEYMIGYGEDRAAKGGSIKRCTVQWSLHSMSLVGCWWCMHDKLHIVLGTLYAVLQAPLSALGLRLLLLLLLLAVADDVPRVHCHQDDTHLHGRLCIVWENPYAAQQQACMVIACKALT